MTSEKDKIIIKLGKEIKRSTNRHYHKKGDVTMTGGDFMNTKLIITEGLPGSGKSTTAALIAEILKKLGKGWFDAVIDYHVSQGYDKRSPSLSCCDTCSLRSCFIENITLSGSVNALTERLLLGVVS